MPTAVGMARGVTSGFNPRTLPGLAWLLHPDDATDVISGNINSLVCRKSGATFTAPSAGARMPLDTTTRAGHKLATATANTQFLRCDDATVAGAINGGVAFTAFWLRKLSSVSNGRSPCIQHSVSTANNGGGDRWLIVDSGSTGHNTSAVEGANTTNYIVVNSTGIDTTSFHFELRTYDGAGGLELFVDNVSVGTATGTARSPTGLAHILWGGSNAGLTVTTYWGVSGLCTGVMSAANRTALYNWVLANA